MTLMTQLQVIFHSIFQISQSISLSTEQVLQGT